MIITALFKVSMVLMLICSMFWLEYDFKPSPLHAGLTACTMDHAKATDCKPLRPFVPVLQLLLHRCCCIARFQTFKLPCSKSGRISGLRSRGSCNSTR